MYAYNFKREWCLKKNLILGHINILIQKLFNNQQPKAKNKQMQQDTKKNKKREDLWREILYSSDTENIKKLLDILRENGNTQILPDIIKLYKGYKGTELGKFIYNFLSDLKSKDAPQIFVSFIKDNEYRNIREDLVTLCWQTGLDFSDFLDDFIDLFINSELKTAFDAFTVIEYFENTTPQDAEKAIEKLQLNIDKISADKKELLVELVQLLRAMH